MSAAAAVLLGTVLARVLVRRGRRGLRAAQAIGAAVAVLSLLLPLTVSATTATRLLLAVMHLVRRLPATGRSSAVAPSPLS